MNGRHCEGGFTLIEVLVASAILMSSIGVLMQLFASGLDRMHRAGEAAHLLAAQRVIVHRLEAINPAAQSEGSGEAEGVRYSWRARLEEPYRHIHDVSGLPPRDLALFAVEVELISAAGKTDAFVYHLPGWRAGR